MTVFGLETLPSDEIEYIKPVAKKHPPMITIAHWQLRDLLLCPTNRKEIIYPCRTNVLQYNTEKEQVTHLLQDLTFAPTSIASGCGYLAAGGQHSELAIRKIDGQWITNTTLGSSINNALSISERPGEPPRLMVCNNDETIKVFSLPSMRKVANILLPTAVNYASVSPDGRRMVAVGDTNQVFLFDISASGQYKRVATYIASNDSSFSCSWNQASDIFAVASQDGIVSVWDIRNSKKLCKLGSKQYPQTKGATRCVKFSPSGSLDLLAFSEVRITMLSHHLPYFSLLHTTHFTILFRQHSSYIDVVDARTFNSRQSVRVAPVGCDAQISGITFTPDSRTLYVGTDNAVMEYDVNTVIRRSFSFGSIL
ncbi:WD40-repeat-containing domain protein [Jimgerdemannia flammicorona]|uniref:WD40-repeat-containing domain protein n=1 Tax=Jimgerdemannia flammicorona TaxID=994334 RepID=A0A433DFG1_9FUNG|nr:WD40-repeat-containing domain protein [Jimgerdemannia flammicorona]